MHVKLVIHALAQPIRASNSQFQFRQNRQCAMRNPFTLSVPVSKSHGRRHCCHSSNTRTFRMKNEKKKMKLKNKQKKRPDPPVSHICAATGYQVEKRRTNEIFVSVKNKCVWNVMHFECEKNVLSYLSSRSLDPIDKCFLSVRHSNAFERSHCKRVRFFNFDIFFLFLFSVVINLQCENNKTETRSPIWYCNFIYFATCNIVCIEN